MATLSIAKATWIDVNSLVTLNGLPDRLPDEQSIMICSLYNLLACPIGGRARTFQPTYGTVLYELLQEPLDDASATSIRIGLIQAIGKWEPRIQLDYTQTWVVPDYNLPGYHIKLTFSLLLTGNTYSQEFEVNR